eukprot:CAMPEP_0204066076 /NCGR_PEP_ID=MMETSP0360-20130528/151253_1 /ASSEMBLY_ACC=CAM_ASM_000342 /TAXON_ID=268821 /ORGANISM="Scrippsiella Hangoei, Strain SHTV-5" /LENGTH=95 /DNA_ID=CAMNT_0051014103 /DNA_START=112 /DNA_END=399 /DNA_ORIENTATION=-
MSQPTLEQDELPRACRVVDNLVVATLQFSFARRGRHHESRSGILESDRGTTGWCFDIVGAADAGCRMDVRGMEGAPRHDIDPTIRHLQLRRILEL